MKQKDKNKEKPIQIDGQQWWDEAKKDQEYLNKIADKWKPKK